MGIFTKMFTCFKAAKEVESVNPYSGIEGGWGSTDYDKNICRECENNRSIIHMLRHMPAHAKSMVIAEQAARSVLRAS